MNYPIQHLILPLAGKATRLMPLTKSINKGMMPVYHQAVIQYALDEASRTDIDNFIFVLSPDDKSMEHYLHHDDELIEKLKTHKTLLAERALKIFATHQSMNYRQIIQDIPKGLGDAVQKGWQNCDSHAVAVSLSDDLMLYQHLSPLEQMIQTHQQKEGAIILLCEEVQPEDVSRYGIITPASSTDESIIAVSSLIEKPALKDAPSRLAVIGRYILNRAVYDALKQTKKGTGGEIQLTDAINSAIQDGAPAYALKNIAIRHDCGSIDGLMKANLAVYEQNRS